MKIIKNVNIKWATSIFSAAFSSIFSTIFSAQALSEPNHQPLTPLPSVIDYTEGNGWSSGIGLKAESAPKFHGSDYYELSIKLEGAVQWRNDNHIFYWEGFDLNYTELGWRGLVKDKWLMEAGLRHEIVIPSARSESSGLDQLPHRGSHVLWFVDTKYAISDGWKNWASGRFTGGSNLYGWQSRIEAGHSFGSGLGNNGLALILFSTFGNENNLNNYFGVSDTDATESGLQAITLDGGYRSSGLNIIYRRDMGENMQITAEAGAEVYSDEIEKSELVTDASKTTVEVSVIWKF